MTLAGMMQGAVPDLEETVELPGLEAPVDVFRDRLGIPHVRARTTHDAFYAQGFVHAQDRLWQMEHDRRKAAGRLAECLGPDAVTMDVFMRRMGLEASARDDYAAFDDDTRAMLDAFAAGVNAFMAMDIVPVELQLLGVDPEPWQPWHCGAVLKVRHVLMGTMDVKLWRARLLRSLGPEATLLLASAHGVEQTVVIPVDGRATVGVEADDLAAALAATEAGEGSNNWAVHGSRTATGKPLVAGDPHRSLEVPNVYYQNHVAGPEFDAIGLSMPGVPGMFHFGHNAGVAWCVTHAMADTQDLYVERFDGEGRYEFRGGWRETDRRTETIRVRGAAPLEVDVTTTHHGPVVLGDPSTGTAIAMRWTGTDGDNTTLRSFLPMLRSSSVDELDEAMQWWVDPCNSFVMADTHGTIGYLHRGRVPVRPKANGWSPVPGWTGEHEWEGAVRFEELPRLRDPEAGYLVTANNRIRAGDEPYLGMDYGGPARARRILDALGSLERATAQDMAAIHADRTSLPARVVVEALVAAAVDGERAEAAQRLLEGWSGVMDPDAAAPAVYASVREALVAVLRERGRLGSIPGPAPDEPDPTPVHTRLRRPVAKLLSTRDTSMLDGTSWDEVATEALERAHRMLEQALGDDPERWRWAGVHATSIIHPLSAVFPQAAGVLDPAPVGCGGDGDTVQVSGAEEGLGVVHSSVARYVFDLADWDRSGWIVPLGASGHPASPHYADQAADWAAVRLQPMTYSWDRVEAGAETRQLLEPR